MKLNIKKRLFGGFGILLLIILIMVVGSFFLINSLVGSQQEVEDSLDENLFVADLEIRHLGWVNDLSDSIVLGEEFEGSLDYEECFMGRWYYDFIDSEEYQNLPSEAQSALDQLEEPHRKLHQSAQKVLEIDDEFGLETEEGQARAMEIYQTETLEHLEGFQGYLDDYMEAMAEEQEVAVAQARANERNAYLLLGILSVIAVAGGLLIPLFIGRSLIDPINRITDYLNQMASGDFSISISGEYTTREDEIGDLASGFKKISNNIQEIITKLKGLIENLSAHSEELSASAEEGNATIEMTDNLVEDMSASIQEISASAEEVTSFAQESSSKTEVGNREISKTLGSISSINQLANQSLNIISDLDDTSEEIGSIVELITNISEQTNLLALNAAIEAARAGDEGQGFSVVAEEIRELAEDTNQATQKISKLIQKTQAKSENGLEAVRELKQEANQGEELAEETKVVFEEIKETSQQTATQIEETATATQDLAEKSDQITTSTDDIQDMSEEITTSSQELATMAQELQELIEEFEV